MWVTVPDGDVAIAFYAMALLGSAAAKQVGVATLSSRPRCAATQPLRARVYHTVLLPLSFYSPKSHRLNFLFGQAELLLLDLIFLQTLMKDACERHVAELEKNAPSILSAVAERKC